ncbi:hypothetical protein [Microbacterium elymi]|uniref:Uncharacterized protein n=1 Tax=Microbacterium elymi TaxID=2909587 RepID=A0ABY5NMF6_9MICO|nr:hypothetical protein [Microbacterium elymi]UUT36299.1 hypothetical protein L2X98_25390 [Microbacterium elymi]
MHDATIDETGWLRPVAGAGPREPRWGHPDGMQIGLHPLAGPRGLIRVFTPYLDQPRDRLVNFIAIEPVPAGQAERGYSELERSRLDDTPGCGSGRPTIRRMRLRGPTPIPRAAWSTGTP